MAKKYKYLMLGLAAATVLAGCGKADDSADKSSTKQEATDSSTADADGSGADSAADDASDSDADGAGNSEDSASGSDADSAGNSEDSASGGDADGAGNSEDGASGGDANGANDAASDSPDGADDSASDSADGADADTLEPITPSDYLVADASDYVKLGSYEGIEVIQYTYDITDEMVQEQIQSSLADAGTEEDVSTPAAEGNIVYLSLKSTIQGSDDEPEEEDTYFEIGTMEYGEEFDQQLTGVKTGDTKQFSITFGDDIWVDAWMNQTVDFEAEITAVTQLSYPEYDEKFLEEYTDYDTKEDYEAAVRADLENEYTEISYSDVIEDLFTSAIDATTFDGYPQELYDSCRDELLSSYALFAGSDDTDVQDVLDAFGITEEDLDSETLNAVNRKLLVSAFCAENKIEITEDEYFSYVEENAAYYGTASAAEFEMLYTRDSLVWNLYEAKMADQLYQMANVTEAAYSEDDMVTDEEFDLEETSEADTEDAEAAGTEADETEA